MIRKSLFVHFNCNKSTNHFIEFHYNMHWLWFFFHWKIFTLPGRAGADGIPGKDGRDGTPGNITKKKSATLVLWDCDQKSSSNGLIMNVWTQYEFSNTVYDCLARFSGANGKNGIDGKDGKWKWCLYCIHLMLSSSKNSKISRANGYIRERKNIDYIPIWNVHETISITNWTCVFSK